MTYRPICHPTRCFRPRRSRPATAIATLGILVAGLRGWRLWLTALVPLGWCLVTGLTLYALGSAWAIAVFVAAGMAVAGIGWKTLRGG